MSEFSAFERLALPVVRGRPVGIPIVDEHSENA